MLISSDIILLLIHKLNVAILGIFLSKWIDSWYLACSTPPTVLCHFFFETLQMFWLYPEKMCIWFGHNPQICLVSFLASQTKNSK